MRKTAFKLLFLNLILLALMSLSRFIFFLYYGKGIDFSGLGIDILKAFYMGVRYDLAVLSYLNIPVVMVFIVLLFIAKSFAKLLSALKYYYAFFIGTLFLLLCVDFGFYSYFQNHLNILVFGFFEDDTKALISTFYENYNLFLIIAGFISIYIIVFLLSKCFLQIDENSSKIKESIIFKIIFSILLAALTFMAARGSFGIFPLGVDNAEVSSNIFINKVAINGVYTLQAAIEAKGKEKTLGYIEITGYKNNVRQAFADFLNKDINDISAENPEKSLITHLPKNKNIEAVKPNVILIVMESFGTDLIKYNSSSFNVLGELQRHFDEDYVFYNFLPGHEGTIGSLEAVITNVARRPYSRYLSQSKYAYEKYNFSGPVPYRNNGYETIFMYGGNTGWRNVGSYMPNLGFDKIFGEGSMNKEYPRNQWGVYDEHLFDYIFKTLETDDDKKFIYVMTTSNHPPYSLPGTYKPLPLNTPEELRQYITGGDLADKRFSTYQYSNEMLGRFITRIKNSKYAENTIIAVTGDHNFWNVFYYSKERIFDSLSVPFYLYIPKKLRPADVNTSVFGSHMDIMPTLYNLSLSNTEYTAMGINLLSEGASDNITFTDVGFVIDKNYVVDYNLKNKEASYYAWDAQNDREIKKAVETEGHKMLVKRFLSSIAISDYLIKNCGEK